MSVATEITWTSPRAGTSWKDLDRATAPFAAALDAEQRQRLVPILLADVLSEYDARFYSAYVRSLDTPLSDSFWAMEEQWAIDEERHCAGFRAVLEGAMGERALVTRELEGRSADFGPIAHLFEDELTIACLGAYDELATVRAYQGNLESYALLGPTFLAYVRDVIADEGWHASRFVKLIHERYADRLAEAREIVARIRATEGIAYGNTFVLDHDDDVFTDEIYDESEAVLLRHLGA